MSTDPLREVLNENPPSNSPACNAADGSSGDAVDRTIVGPPQAVSDPAALDGRCCRRWWENALAVFPGDQHKPSPDDEPHHQPPHARRSSVDPEQNELGASLRFGAWCLLLFVTFLVNRCVSVWLHIPSDGHDSWGTLFFMEGVQSTMMWGFVQAWFIGATELGRLESLLSGWRGALFVASLMLSGPIFGWIGDFPALASGLSSDAALSTIQTTMYGALAVVVALVLVWHVFYVRRVRSLKGVGTYIGSRAAVLVFYGMYSAALLLADDPYEYHHYFLAWAVSLSARFRHPLSTALLGISTGIFVQGISSYGAAELFSSKTSTQYTIIDDSGCVEYYDCYKRVLCDEPDLESYRSVLSSGSGR